MSCMGGNLSQCYSYTQGTQPSPLHLLIFSLLFEKPQHSLKKKNDLLAVVLWDFCLQRTPDLCLCLPDTEAGGLPAALFHDRPWRAPSDRNKPKTPGSPLLGNQRRQCWTRESGAVPSSTSGGIQNRPCNCCHRPWVCKTEWLLRRRTGPQRPTHSCVPP